MVFCVFNSLNGAITMVLARSCSLILHYVIEHNKDVVLTKIDCAVVLLTVLGSLSGGTLMYIGVKHYRVGGTTFV